VAAKNQRKRHGLSRASLWRVLAVGATAFLPIAAGWASFNGIHWYQIAFAGVAAVLAVGLERQARHEAREVNVESADRPELWHVPPPNPQFSGRDEELARLRALFAESAVVAIYGIGGVGKTQLATEYAQKYAHGAADDYEIVWWIAADPPDLVEMQLATIATSLGLMGQGADPTNAAHTARSHLRGRSKWLLVFDNAQDAAALRPWLPGGDGHVLITSLHGRWRELGTSFELDVLRRAGSAELLRRGRGDLCDDEVEVLADRLDGLPLAIAQAIGMLEGGMTAREYVEQLDAKAAQILDEDAPPTHMKSLTAATRVSLSSLVKANPAAAHLLRVCAFLAPEPIPARMLNEAARIIGPSALWPDDNSAFREMVRQITWHGLARGDQSALQMHRLTQEIIRDQSIERAIEQAEAISLLVRACPGDPRKSTSWAYWAEFLPHLEAADLVTTNDEGLRQVGCAALWYLLCSGASETALSMAQKIREGWGIRYGTDDALTLRVADAVAQAYRDLGRFAQACEVDEDTMERRRRVLGDDHADTLAAAHNLALDHHALGRFAQARRLNEETYAARCRILGTEHPDTLASANNLAIDLYADGDPSAAIRLDETTLQLCRRILGPEDLCLFTSENNLAVALRAVGDEKRARRLHEDLLDRRRAALGNDHPHTLTSLNNVGVSLRASGDAAGARLTHERALEQRRALYGDDHHDTLTSASNLAVALYFLGEYKAARVLNEDTLKRRRRVLGEDHPDTLMCAGNLAACLRATGAAAPRPRRESSLDASDCEQSRSQHARHRRARRRASA
jgi:tetratricopeptide (TPR) repeat protein